MIMQPLVVIFVCILLVSVHGFRGGLSSRLRMPHSSLSMTPDFLGVMPVCLEATAKTTTINDATAGMSPEEITDYISNVGGGMCGYPDWVRTAIGLGLNVSLLVFGVFTIGYVVLGGYEFTLKSGVEDSIKKMPQGDKLLAMAEKAEKQGALFNSNAGSSFSTQAMNMDPSQAALMVPEDTSFDNMQEQQAARAKAGGILLDDNGGFDMDIDAKGNIYDKIKAKEKASGERPLSREERRLAKRLGKGDNKASPNPNKY